MMAPRLQAEESLLAALRTGVGTGAVASGPTISRRWQREAGVAADHVPPVPQMFSPQALGVIGVRRVPNKVATS